MRWIAVDSLECLWCVFVDIKSVTVADVYTKYIVTI